MGVIFLLFLIFVGGSIAVTVVRGNNSGKELSALRVLGSVYYGMAAFCVFVPLFVRV